MKAVLVRVAVACALIAASAQCAAADVAMSDQTRADLRCFIAVMQTSKAMDTLNPGASKVAIMYFYGRLDGEDPKLDLEAAILDELPKMSMQDIAAADMRCGLEMKDRSNYMDVVGQHLIDRATGRR